MESLQFSADTKQLQLIKIDIPEHVESNEILIKVAYAGICGTDLHIIDVSYQINLVIVK